MFRSRSRSPREWKRPERRGADRDRGNDRQSRDPHAKVRLYVSNLPYDIRWQDLKDLFREKGKLLLLLRCYGVHYVDDHELLVLIYSTLYFPLGMRDNVVAFLTDILTLLPR